MSAGVLVEVRGVWLNPNHVIAVGRKYGNVVVDMDSGITLNLGLPAGDDDLRKLANRINNSIGGTRE